MNDDSKKEFKEYLNEEIVILKRDIERYLEASKPVAPDNSLGRLTRMDAIQSKSINAAALTKARNQLANYERALSKLDDDNFGICTKCKNEIPIERLMVMPSTTLCTGCIN